MEEQGMKKRKSDYSRTPAHEVFKRWCLGSSINTLALQFGLSTSGIRTVIRVYKATGDLTPDASYQRLNTCSAKPGK